MSAAATNVTHLMDYHQQQMILDIGKHLLLSHLPGMWIMVCERDNRPSFSIFTQV